MCISNMTTSGRSLSSLSLSFLLKFSAKCFLGNLCRPRWDISRHCGLCEPLTPAPRRAAASSPWLRGLRDSGGFSAGWDPRCCRWVPGRLCSRALPCCFTGPGSVKPCCGSLLCLHKGGGPPVCVTGLQGNSEIMLRRKDNR